MSRADQRSTGSEPTRIQLETRDPVTSRNSFGDSGGMVQICRLTGVKLKSRRPVRASLFSGFLGTVFPGTRVNTRGEWLRTSVPVSRSHTHSARKLKNPFRRSCLGQRSRHLTSICRCLEFHRATWTLELTEQNGESTRDSTPKGSFHGIWGSRNIGVVAERTRATGSSEEGS